MSTLLFALLALAAGAFLAAWSPWVPVLLGSVLLFLASAIYGVVTGSPLLATLLWSCLPVVVLQASYVVVGLFQERAARRAALEAPARKAEDVALK